MESIPQELIHITLSKLPLDDILSFGLVNKRMYYVCRDESFWHSKMIHEFKCYSELPNITYFHQYKILASKYKESYAWLIDKFNDVWTDFMAMDYIGLYDLNRLPLTVERRDDEGLLAEDIYMSNINSVEISEDIRLAIDKRFLNRQTC